MENKALIELQPVIDQSTKAISELEKQIKDIEDNLDPINLKLNVETKTIKELVKEIEGITNIVKDSGNNMAVFDESQLTNIVDLYEASLLSAESTTDKYNSLLESTKAQLNELVESSKNSWHDILNEQTIGLFAEDIHKNFSDGLETYGKNYNTLVNNIDGSVGSFGKAKTAIQALKMSFNGAATGAKILKIGLIGLKAAATMGIGLLVDLAVGKLFEVIDNWIHRAENLKKANEEAMQSYQDNIGGLNSDIKSLKELSDEYDTLSKITNKTSVEQERYYEVMNKIASISSEAVDYHDAKGNAILKENINLEKLIENHERFIELTDLELVDNGSQQFKQFKTTLGKSEKISELNKEIQELETGLESLIRAERIGEKHDLEDPWVDDLIKEQSDEIKEKKKERDILNRDLDQNTYELKPYLNAVMRTAYGYKELSSGLQEVAGKFVNDLEIDPDDTWSLVKQKIENFVYELTDNEIKSIVEDYAHLVELYESGKITASKYKKGIDDLNRALNDLDNVPEGVSDLINATPQIKKVDKLKLSMQQLQDEMKEFNKATDEYYDAQDKLQNIYDKVADNDKLSNNELQWLIENYPKLADAILDANTSIEKRKELIKETAEIEKNTHLEYLADQKQKVENQRKNLIKERNIYLDNFGDVSSEDLLKTGIVSEEINFIGEEELQTLNAFIEEFDLKESMIKREEKPIANEHKETGNENEEIEKINISLSLEETDSAPKYLTQSLEDVSYQLDTLDDGDGQQKLNLLHKRIQLNKELASHYEEQVKSYEELKIQYADNERAVKEIEEAIEGLKDTSRETNMSILTDMKEARTTMTEVVESVEEKIKDIIRARYEEEERLEKESYDTKKKNLEKELKDKTRSIDAQIKALDRLHQREDFEDDITDLTSDKNKIQAEIDMLRLDDSEESKSKVKGLLEDLAGIEEQITDKQTDRDRKVKKQNLEDELSDFQKHIEDKQEILDNDYEKFMDDLENRSSEYNIFLETQEVLATGKIKNINDEMVNLTDAYTSFEKSFGEGLSYLSEEPMDNFIGKIQMALNFVQQLSAAANGIGGGIFGNTTDNLLVSYTSGEEFGVREVLEGSGYTVKWDSERGQALISKGTQEAVLPVEDFILKNGRYYGTMIEIFNALDKMGFSYSQSEIIGHTGLPLTDGSKLNPELALTNQDTAKLYNSINNLPVGAAIMPPVREINNSIDFSIGKLINVEGNVDKNVIADIKQVGENVMNNIRRELNKLGYYGSIG